MTNLNNRQKSGAAFSVLMLAVIIFSFAVGLIGEMLFPEKGSYYRCFLSLGSAVPLLTITLFMRKLLNNGKDEFSGIGLKSCHVYYFIAAILLSCGMFLGLGFINVLVSDAIVAIGGKVSADFAVNGAAEFVVALICLCVLPAVTEELFFRGLLLGGLTKTKKVAAVIAVSLSFALYHSSLTQFFYQALYGVGLCCLTLNAKSVFPAIAAHFLNNAVVVIFKFTGVSPDLFSVWFIIAGVALIAAFYAFLFFYKREKIKVDNNFSKIGGYYAFSSLGILVAVLTAVLGAVL